MLTEAEQYLLEQIRSGKQDAWSQLVDRYQGRLLAFARSKVRDGAEAEDLVQDTFVSFLRSLDNFRSQASLETYLFSILRRKIIDLYRGRRVNVCLLQDGLSPDGESDPGNLPLAAPDPTASWYARRDEDHDLKRSALAAALTDLIEGYKRELNFRDLQIVEMLFYCQLRNKDISQTAGVTVNHVAVIKHRCLNQIREQILRRLPRQSDAADLFTGADGPVPEAADSMIAEIWQERRLSCPKRSTLGAWMLGTLEPAWTDYVRFHVERLGCRFCRANLDDLEQQTATEPAQTFRDRILQSTIGFLKN
ncbi:MAG TPA: sigma-70 family RNA polymerase sigma factor [Phycisphaerae bacterium]|nr:sigma-70 family RNA polymerase sigma factor [Phycisphaerae bacterium]HOJ73947.1 sigma-70 family RNA polymerase sigma factor [Phycisphaerae bacterium]HOM50888.1 sigma-70 family RNA polymerase sigma factor [Phycisphaerae bacterium]HON65539.1 sigma-70 family RNA polymerase sigma factor [Phycisphaerae bacterium]HOQ87246.1 sigma-70 family RNA polymerase sigma factor [Phycisphaerae bacterium]